MDIDALFKGMQDAPMFGRGNYMAEGIFLIEITNVFVKERWKGGNVFVCEFRILESNSDKHKFGTTGSWVPKIEQPNTFGDIKSLMFALSGVEPKSVKKEDVALHTNAAAMARAACGSDAAKKELGVEDGFLNGTRVRLETTAVKTKEGKDFTRYTWSPA